MPSKRKTIWSFGRRGAPKRLVSALIVASVVASSFSVSANIASAQSESEPPAAPETASEGTTVWTGVLTVETDESVSPPMSGFSIWARNGSLSPRVFRVGGSSHRVSVLVEHAGGLFLAMGSAVSTDFVLSVGDREFVGSESAVPSLPVRGAYWWPTDGALWSDGDEVDIAMWVADDAEVIGERPLAPLYAYFDRVPSSHDGSDEFTVRLRFGEEIDADAASLRDEMLVVEGGSVTAVEAAAAGLTRDWTVTVAPDVDADVTLRLPSGLSCSDSAAVCTSDARTLHTDAEVTILGPVSATSLSSLTVGGAPLTPAFAPDRSLYTAQAATTLAQATVGAVAPEGSTVHILPSDADATAVGHQVELAENGETVVAVKVTAPASGAERWYWVVVSQPSGGSEDAAGGEPPRLSGIALSGLESLELVPDENRYVISAVPGVSSSTVVVAREQTDATVEILVVRSDDAHLSFNAADADPITAGHQIWLSLTGDTVVLVRVTSADGMHQRAYVVLVDGIATAPAGETQLRSAFPGAAGTPSLSVFGIEGQNLVPAFAASTLSYTATVGADVSEITVTATAADADAEVMISPADADANTAGWQVALPLVQPGDRPSQTAITVVVRSGDQQDLNTYMLTVNREAPAAPVTPAEVLVDPDSVSISENGVGSFDVTLSRQPSADVSVTFASGDSGAVSVPSGTLTFTSSTWGTAQTVTVEGVADDDVADEAVQVTVAVSSTDVDYQGVSGSVAVSVDDSDTAGLVLSESSLDIGEDGSGSFTVKLASRPLADVSVSFASGDAAAVSVTSGTLTFTSSTWSQAQIVTVEGVADDDVADEAVQVTVTASSTDAGYAGVSGSVAVSVDDSDTAGLVLSESSLDIGEDGSASFTVKLASRPLADVSVSFVSGDAAAVSVTSGTLTFTTTTWGTAQTVTVEGVADDDAADEAVQVTVAVSSTDADYAGVSGSVAVSVDDSDTAGLVLSESSLDIGEDGSGSFTVKLVSRPLADVSVSFASGDAAAVSVTSGSLTFTSSTWGTAQTVTVEGVADDDAADEAVQVTVTASSTDVDYQGVSGSVAVSVDDSDTAGLVLSESSLDIGEDGSASFTVKLASRPLADVSVSFASGDAAAVSVTSGTLTFTSSTWSTAQTVTVEGVADDDAADEAVTVTASASSTDTDYAGVSDSVDVEVDDSDTAGLVLSESLLDIGEDGSGTFTVKLASRPLADVSVSFASGDAAAVSVTSGTLTFTSSTWSQAQTVTVEGVADDDAGDEAIQVTVTASSTDVDYAGVSGSVDVEVDDSDTAGLVLSESSLDIGEDGSGTFTVKLASRPLADVSVSFASGDAAAVLVTSGTLTFTSSTWGTAQTVTVEGVADDDAGDEAIQVTVTVSSTDLDYQGVSGSVAVSVDDSDTAGLVLSESSLDIGEDGSASFTVKLASRPLADVSVSFASGDAAAVSVATGTLTFTTTTWGTAQAVTVEGVADDDVADEAVQVTVAVSSTDVDYQGVSGSVAVSVEDSDTPAIVVDPVSLSIGEDGSASFTVKLASRPLADVSVSFASGDAAAVSVPSGSLTFTASTWGTAQTVTVQGVADDDAGDETIQVTATASSTDVDYQGVSGSVDVEVDDSDTAGLVLSESSLDIGEDGSASFTVKLASRPLADVSVSFASGDAAAVSVPSGSLTFTASTWGTAQTVTVEGVADDDAGDEAVQVTVAASSTDTDYAGVSGSVDVEVDDSDTAGLVLSESSLDIGEDGSGSFTVKLASQPLADVSVSFVSGDAAAVSVPSGTLTFTATTWGTAQTVTVEGVADDDAADEAAQVTASASSTDAGYAGVSGSVDVEVDDSDTAGLVLSESSLDIGEDGSGSFTVKLASRPSADVSVSFASGDAAAVSVTSGTLTFTSSTWSQAQTVTVQGVADDDVADETVTVTVAVSSTDVDYQGVSGSVAVSVEDSDAPAIVVDPVSLSITEDGSGSFTVKLASRPLADVSVSFASGDAAAVSVTSGTLTFTSSTWGTAQTVTLQGVADDDAADETVTVTVSASSTDAGYAGVSGSVAVSVDDSDTAGLVLSESSLDIGEDGSGSFTVKLASRPLADVSVSFASGDAAAVSVTSGTLTFTASTWGTAQTVTVEGVADDDAADEAVQVTASASSTDTDYAAVSDSVAVVVEDSDAPAIVVDPASLSIAEDSSGSFTVKLATQPAAMVLIQVSSANRAVASVPPNFLFFTTEDWDQAQTVTVTTAADDDAIDSSVNIVVTAITSDTDYDQQSQTVQVSVLDTDTAELEVPSSLVIAENGTGTFMVKLTSRPAAAVTVNLSSGDTTAATSVTETLRFGPGDWDVHRVVVVTGLPDADARDEAVTFTLTASSTGSDYDGKTAAVSVTVEDPDTADLVIGASTLDIDEGSNASFTVKLSSQPSAPVTVTVSSDDADAASVPTSELTFTTESWNVKQSVAVDGVGDVDTDDETVTLTVSSSSTDSDYSGNVATVAVAVTDTTDGNLPPTINNATTSVPLDENTALNLQVLGDDVDAADPITAYAIDGGTDAALFAISATGVLTMTKDGAAFLPDFETPQDAGNPPDNRYEVVVKVTSGTGERELSATASFQITITNVAEYPAVPANLAVTQANLDSLGLSWEEPTNSGPALLRYNIEYVVGGVLKDVDQLAGATSMLLEDADTFTPNKGVKLRIRAVNGDGAGDWSTQIRARLDDCGAGIADACGTSTGRSRKYEINVHDTTPDRDWFEIDLLGNVEYQVDVLGSATTTSTLDDPHLAVYDSTGTAVAGLADDNNGTGDDPQVRFTPAADEAYYIEVSESGGDALGTYRVVVTAINTPPTFESGSSETVFVDEYGQVSFITAAYDDDAEDTAKSYSIIQNVTDGGADYADFSVNSLGFVISRPDLKLDYEAKQVHVVKVTATTGSGTRAKSSVQTITVVVNDVDCAADDSTVCLLAVGTAELEDIGPGSDDVDWFEVELTGSRAYDIEVSGDDASPPGGTLADPVVTLYNAAGSAVTVSGRIVADSDADGDGAANISFVPDSTATYYVTVSEDGADAAGSYTVQVTEFENNAPRITNSDPNVTLLENTALNFQVTAVDDDTDDAVNSYAIAGGFDQSLFAIDSNGVLTMVLNGSALLPDFERPDDLQGNPGSADGVYEVEVQVQSGIGARALTGSATFTVTVADDDNEAPEVPLRLRLTNAEIATLAFAWNAPHNPGPDPLDYELQYRPVGETAWIDGVATASRTGAATSLDAGTEYEAQVRARGAESDGAWSSPVSSWTDDCSEDTASNCSLAGNASSTGRIDRRSPGSDADWFAVTLTSGTNYQIDVEGDVAAALGGTLADPLVALMDASGAAVAGARNNNGGEGNNARLTLGPSLSGTFYIAVSANGGSGVGTYTVELSIIDDCTAATDTACAASDSTPVSGSIEQAGDTDWFSAALEADTQYRFEVSGSAASAAGGTLADPAVTLHDPAGSPMTDAGTPLADSDADGDGIATIVVTPATSGTHYIEVASGSGTALGTYTVTMHEILPNTEPRITNSDHSVELAENAVLALQIVAVDDDSSDSITGYVISGGADGALFDVNGNGVLSMTKDGATFSPNYEQPFDAGTPPDNVYEVQITVTSGTAGRELSATADFTVTVTDVNESISAPQHFRVVSVSLDSVTLAWDPSTTTGPAVTSYVVDTEELDRSNPMQTIAAGSATSVTVSGLTIGQEFRNRIKAVSDEGESSWSAFLHIWTDNCGADQLTACALNLRGTRDGRIDKSDGGDRDWYGIELTADTDYRFRVVGGSGNAKLADPTLAIYHADSNPVMAAGVLLVDVDGEDPTDLDDTARVLFTPDIDGIYYIEVAEFGNDGTGTFKVSAANLNSPPSFDEGTTRTVSATEFASFSAVANASESDAVDRPISYSIAQNAIDGGADHDAFDIDTSTGELTFKNAARADYETRPAYTVKVTAASGAGTRLKSAVQTITVAVNDVECAAADGTECSLVDGVPETEDIGSAGSDTDWFEVSMNAGNVYLIVVSGNDATPSGGTLVDPVVTLYDSAGHPVTVSGTEAADADTDGDGRAVIEFVSEEVATYYVAVAEDGGDAVGTYTATLSDITPRTVSEPSGEDLPADNTTPGHVLVDESATGSINAAGDKDWFGVELSASRVYRVSVTSGANSGLADPVVSLYDRSGAAVAVSGTALVDSDDDDDGAASFEFVPDGSATFFVEASGLAGASGAYTVQITDVTPVGVRQLAAGIAHTCVLKDDGSVHCWGDTSDSRTVVPQQSQYISVGTGERTTCAVTTDGQLSCWGVNSGGVATPPAGNDFAYVDVGRYHACALKTDGTVACWGLGTYIHPPTAVAAGDEPLSALATGASFSCGIVASDQSLACWGSAGGYGLASVPSGQFDAVAVGNAHVCGLKTDATVTCWGNAADRRTSVPTQPDGSVETFARIDAGDDHTCGIRQEDASVVCWGKHSSELNNTATAGAYIQIATGEGHVCGLRDNGAVYCWGDNEAGQTALPDDLAADDCADANDTVCVIAAGGAARGRTDGSDDVDWFAVELDPGMEYTVYVAGSLGDDAVTDPWIVGMHDSSGAAIAGTSDTDSGSTTDSFLVFGHSEAVTSTFYVAVGSQDGSLGDYWLRILPRMPGADVSESTSRDLPDNAGTSGHVTRGGAARGSIDVRAQGHDEDAFAVALETGRIYLIDVRGECTSSQRLRGGTLTRPAVELRRADGTRVFADLALHLNPVDALADSQFADSGSGQCQSAQLEIEALTDGVYYIVVRARTSSDTGSYTVEVTEVVRIADLDAGADHTCVRSSDRTVQCWGDSADGRTTPPAAVSLMQIGVGPDAACGVGDDGTVACWGKDDSSNTQNLPPSAQFTHAGVGDSHGCGLLSDGTVSCWGNSAGGRTTPPASVTFSQISVGAEFSCGVGTDGSLACWGRDRDGLTSAPAGLFTAVAAGTRHACAIAADGTVSCWGHSSNGKTTPPAGQFSSIDVFDDAACGITPGAQVACWGNDRGSGRVDDAPTAGAWIDVAVGSSHACALAEDTTVLCWGDNSSSQTDAPFELVADDCGADDSTACSFAAGSSVDGHIQAPEDVDWFVIELDPDVTYKMYLDGGDPSAGQAEDVEIVGVYDDSGSLIAGTSDTDSGRATDSLVLFEHSASAAADFYVAVALQSGEKGAYRLSVSPFAPGADVSEQTGEDLPDHAGTTGHVTVGGSVTGAISQLAIGSDVDAFGIMFEAGKSYRIDVRGDCTADPGGTLSNPELELLRIDWSRNFAGIATHLNAVDAQPASQFRDSDSGECGNASLEIEVLTDGVQYISATGSTSSDTGTYTVEVTDTTTYRVETIAAGESHTCAWIGDGSVQCWGNTSNDRTVPPADTLFAQIDVGPAAACGVTDEGGIECWGLNNSGNVNRSVSGRQFAWAGVGDAHGCALRNDGNVTCWGDDSNGRATPPTDANGDPVQFSSLSVGPEHSCGVTSNGSLECWGRNRRGSTNPPSTGTYTAVATGDRYACAIGDDGTVVCWGDDADGRATPPTGTFTAIDSIDAFACGVMTDKSVACWGDDSAQGSVSGAPDTGSYASVAVGSDHACALSEIRIVTCWGSDDDNQLAPPVTLPSGNVAPRFTSSANARVNEHRPLSHTVVAVDANYGEEVSYAITGGADMATFVIDIGTGVLTQAAGVDFDFETGQTSFTVVVTATSGHDDRELSVSQTITVTVGNVGEPPPRPDLPTVHSIGSNFIEFDWTAASHNGPVAETVYVQYRTATQESYTAQYTFDFALANEQGGRIRIENLEPGTTYHIRLAIVNADRPSPWSVPLTFNTADAVSES